MKKFPALALALFLVGAALSGCGKATQSLTSTAEGGATGADAQVAAELNAAVEANPAFVDEDLSADPMTMVVDPSVSPVPSRHRPLRWWRTITSATKTVDFVYGNPDSLGRPTTAIATVNRHLLGRFNVVMRDSTGPDSGIRIVRKPLDDHWVRRIALRRFRIDSAGIVSMWRVVGTSGVEVTSEGATTNIQSVRIQAGGLDSTITDPLQLHRLRRVVLLPCFVPVRLTVTTDRNDDLVYLYRRGERRLMTNNGDGTYSIGFIGLDFGGLRHVGVNAFSRGTITGETDPYDSNAWILPHAARDWDAVVDRDGDDQDNGRS